MQFFGLMGFILALVALNQIAGLKKEIENLKSQIDQKK